MKALRFLRRFRLYQKERFPVVVLLFSLIPAVLSSGAVVSNYFSWFQVACALIACIAYLLHIRIIDEHRDFQHDNEHYKSRPIQSGVITRAELRFVDFVVVAIMVGIAGIAGIYALGIALAMLAYSYLAGKEFFLGEKLRAHFFIYNGVNLIQMLLMQVFVYALFAGFVPFTTLLFVHLLFTSVGTIMFEFLRKIKIPGEDGTGKDTYTWYLGFTNALWVHFTLLVLNVVLFLWVLSIVGAQMVLWYVVAFVAVVCSVFWILLHHKKKNNTTEKLLQLALLLQYGILNLIIYFCITTL